MSKVALKRAGSFGPLLWALDQSQDLTASAKHLLIAICRYAGADGANSFPSVARLVSDTLLSRRTVQVGLRMLEESGYVLAVQGGGRNRTSRYRLPRYEAFLSGNGATTAPFVVDETAQPLRPLEPETAQPLRCLRAETPPERAQFLHERAQISTLKGATTAPKQLVTTKEATIGGDEQHDHAAASCNQQATPRRTRIDPNWQPDQAGIEHARQAGIVDVEANLAKFRDHHLAKGSVMADWPAAWRTWCSNASRFSSAKPAFGNGLHPANARMQSRADGGQSLSLSQAHAQGAGDRGPQRMPGLNDPLEAWHWLADTNPDGSQRIETGEVNEAVRRMNQERGTEPSAPKHIGHPMVRGFYLVLIAADVADLARADDPCWDWTVLCAWLRDGIRSDTIKAAVRRVAAHHNYTVPASLKYFDAAVRKAPQGAY